MPYNNRKSTRLKGYDYSNPGYYYVTICTKGKKDWFGSIINEQMELNKYGMITKKYLKETLLHFNNVNIDEYIIMPNHIHIIIKIVGAGSPRPGFPRPHDKLPSIITNQNHIDNGRGNRAPTVGHIVAYFKYGTTKRINQIRQTPKHPVWQRNYYDHIIRNEKSLNEIRGYIRSNPVEKAGAYIVWGQVSEQI